MGMATKAPPPAWTPSQILHITIAKTEKIPAPRKKKRKPAVNTVGTRNAGSLGEDWESGVIYYQQQERLKMTKALKRT
ncbi:MAG: hypothetical protein ABJL55_03330 [Roseibium sp.]